MTIKIKSILDDVISTIRDIPVKLSGDDSPLADPWEEIKEQVQQEKSFYWQSYLETMKGIIEGTVDSLSKEDREIIASELKTIPEDFQKICQIIMKRLIAKAKREKIRYEPFSFTHFRYSISGMTIYAQVIMRTGIYTCEIMAYSRAAPFGERGVVNTNIIEDTMSKEDFDQARQQNWPVKWQQTCAISTEKSDLSMYMEVSRNTALSVDEVMRVSEALLEALHKRLVEYRRDYFGEMAHWDLSEKAFYHLLGFVEQFSKEYEWESGFIAEYLGRLPPVERWKTLVEETKDWNWQHK